MLLRCNLEKDSAENLVSSLLTSPSFFISFSPVLVSLATSVLGIPITVRKSGERLAARWTVKKIGSTSRESCSRASNSFIV